MQPERERQCICRRWSAVAHEQLLPRRREHEAGVTLGAAVACLILAGERERRDRDRRDRDRRSPPRRGKGKGNIIYRN